MSITLTDGIGPPLICDLLNSGIRQQPTASHQQLEIVKAPVAFTGIALAALAFACAPRSRSGDAATRAARAQKGEAPRIESALAVNSESDANGVRFAFHVTNAGGGKVEMQFPTGQTHDVVVLDTLGKEVWRWSQGRMFTKLMQNKVLRTADTLAFDERWKDASRGQYVAVARLASGNYPIETRTPFVVR
jgi:hypothetical protein